MAKKVFLSPSDHGEGQNKCLHSGCYEDKHTRPIAEACAKYLKASGFEVEIGTANQSLSARCKDSDTFKADLHVPIHTNASANKTARYLMFMFYGDNEKYRNLFNAVAPELEAIYPGQKESVFAVRTNLAEITKPRAISLYCELGFHTNVIDCDSFIHNTDAVGKALAKGICNYFGVAFKEAKKEYTQKQFVKDVQKAIGAAVDGIPGNETISKTPTVSAKKNSTHAVVKYVQKYLYAIGYTQVGTADGIAGAKFTSAVKAFQKKNGCWADGVITAKNKTWRKLLGMK